MGVFPRERWEVGTLLQYVVNQQQQQHLCMLYSPHTYTKE